MSNPFPAPELGKATAKLKERYDNESRFIFLQTICCTVTVLTRLHLRGFALAGAGYTLNAWERGEAPTTDNGGIVTGGEV